MPNSQNSKRRTYIVTIGKHSPNFNMKYKDKYEYRFSRTTMNLSISKNSIQIQCTMKSESGCDNLFPVSGKSCFRDAIKKAYMLYIIKYKTGFNNQPVNVCIKNHNGEIKEEKCIYNADTNQPFIYSMIDRDLVYTDHLDYFYQKDFIKWFLKQTKSKSGCEMACFYAYVLSKIKIFESERFLYLWTAMNGFYGAIYKRCCSIYGSFKTKKGKIKKLGDSDQILLLSILLEFGINAIRQEHAKKIADQVKGVLNTIELSQVDFTQENIKQKIEPLIISYDERKKDSNENSYFKYDGAELEISAYGYMLLWYPYYYRCSRFHGNVPMHLFSLAEEPDIVILRTVNNLIDNFLSENFHLLIDEDEKFKQFADKNIEQAKKIMKL